MGERDVMSRKWLLTWRRTRPSFRSDPHYLVDALADLRPMTPRSLLLGDDVRPRELTGVSMPTTWADNLRQHVAVLPRRCRPRCRTATGLRGVYATPLLTHAVDADRHSVDVPVAAWPRCARSAPATRMPGLAALYLLRRRSRFSNAYPSGGHLSTRRCRPGTHRPLLFEPRRSRFPTHAPAQFRCTRLLWVFACSFCTRIRKPCVEGRGKLPTLLPGPCDHRGQTWRLFLSCLLASGARGGSATVPRRVFGVGDVPRLRQMLLLDLKTPVDAVATSPRRASSISWPIPTFTASMSGSQFGATARLTAGAASAALRGRVRRCASAPSSRGPICGGGSTTAVFITARLSPLTSDPHRGRTVLRCWPRLPCPVDPLRRRRLCRAPGAARPCFQSVAVHPTSKTPRPAVPVVASECAPAPRPTTASAMLLCYTGDHTLYGGVEADLDVLD